MENYNSYCVNGWLCADVYSFYNEYDGENDGMMGTMMGTMAITRKWKGKKDKYIFFNIK